MLDETQSLCELWEDLPSVAVPHSRLYPLEPIGIGEPLVESLTSYISRLAEVHSLYPRVLITDEILPRLSHSHLYHNDTPTYTHLTTFWKRSAILNGTSVTTSDWVQVLEQATGRKDIQFLTMLAWGQVLSPRGLVRRLQAWCSACYEEWRETKHPLYQPLIWSLEVIQICPRHRISLQITCPYSDCGQTLAPLAPKAFIGFCSHCQRWLGIRPTLAEERQEMSAADQEWQHWIGAAVGEMTATANQLATEPRPEVFAATIATYIQRVLGGNTSLFARQLHIHRRPAWEWAQGQEIPQLTSLLQVGQFLGVTPVRFFLNQPLIHQAVHNQAQIHLQEKPRRHYRKFENERIRAALEAILQEKEAPPPSMREVGRRLHYDTSHLAKHFPAHCHAISAQFCAYQQASSVTRQQQICSQVEKIARSLQAQGYSTSQRQIGKWVKKRGVFREQVVRTTLTTTRQT